MIRKKVLEERTKFAQLNDINGARIKELRLIRNELDDDLQRQRHINESVMADLEQ